jgi:putative hemolysin
MFAQSLSAQYDGFINPQPILAVSPLGNLFKPPIVKASNLIRETRMKRTNKLSAILVLCLAIFATACNNATPAATTEAPVGLPNPASVYCEQQGGTLLMQTRGDGGQYGVCLFTDNLQCEEWAMYRGECPIGGIKITGYITQAAQYCAITGGAYAITSTDAAGVEQGA